MYYEGKFEDEFSNRKFCEIWSFNRNFVIILKNNYKADQNVPPDEERNHHNNEKN